MSRDGENPSADLTTMSRLPSPIVKHHQSMWAFGYHFRAQNDRDGDFVTFDSGVAAIINQECRSSRADQHPVEAELLYVGVINDILQVDYGHIKPCVLKCSWIKSDLEGVPTMRRDVDGFWSVKFMARQSPAVEPYLLAAHARQVCAQTSSMQLVICYAFLFPSTMIRYMFDYRFISLATRAIRSGRSLGIKFRDHKE